MGWDGKGMDLESVWPRFKYEHCYVLVWRKVFEPSCTFLKLFIFLPINVVNALVLKYFLLKLYDDGFQV